VVLPVLSSLLSCLKICRIQPASTLPTIHGFSNFVGCLDSFSICIDRLTFFRSIFSYANPTPSHKCSRYVLIWEWRTVPTTILFSSRPPSPPPGPNQYPRAHVLRMERLVFAQIAFNVAFPTVYLFMTGALQVSCRPFPHLIKYLIFGQNHFLSPRPPIDFHDFTRA